MNIWRRRWTESFQSRTSDGSWDRRIAESATVPRPEVLMSQVSPGCREWLLKEVSQSWSAEPLCCCSPDCATPRLSVISWIYERVLRPTWCTRDVRVCPRAFTTGTRVIAFLPTPRGNYNFRGLRLASAVIFFILSFLQLRCGFRRLNSRWADFTRTTTTAGAN